MVNYFSTQATLQEKLKTATVERDVSGTARFDFSSDGPPVVDFDSNFVAAVTQAQADLDKHIDVGTAKWGKANVFTPWTAAQITTARELLRSTVAVPTVIGFTDPQAMIRWQNHDIFLTNWETKRIAASIFIAADVTGLAYSGYQLSIAIKNNDYAGIAFGAVDALGSTLTLIADGVDYIKKPSLKTSIVSARASGSGLILAQLAASGASLYANAKYYQQNPNNNYARDAVIVDAAIQTAMLAITAFLMMTGPIGMVVGTVVLLGMPNAAAIRQVRELQDQQRRFNNQGRTVWGNTVLAPFIKIAEMNTNSLVAMASFGYAEAEMNKLADRMKAGKMQELLAQDYKYYLFSETSTETVNGVATIVQQKALNTISNDIDVSLTNTSAGAVKIASFINIDRQVADEKNYYASKTSNKLTYASRLDVRKKKIDGTIDFDVAAMGLNDSVITTTISDIAGTERDSLIIVNVSADETLMNGKTIDITSTTTNNKVNFYVTAQNVNITGSRRQAANITVVEGKASAVTVTSLSGLDVVSYSGASLNADGTVANPAGVTLWNQINLNNYTNVAAVIAGATTMRNTVTGTVAKQRYSFNNGRDKVTMTGGQGATIVGGRETELLMAGGNNYASVKLGSRVDGMAWASDARQGVYDGGAVAAASGTRGKDDYLGGTNTISFADAYAKLQIDIVEPLSSVTGTDYTTDSKVTTVGLDVQDTGAFRNFQTVMGSHFGDTINITGTSTLQSLFLGMGQNSVSITNVKAPTATSAADKTALTITALLSLDAAPSDITLNNSDVGFEGSLNLNNKIQVSNGSSFAGALRGRDRIFTDNNASNLVKVLYAEGDHVLNLHGGDAEVIMATGYSGDAVITVDENAATAIATTLVLGGNQFNQMVMRDAAGLHFSMAQTNGDAQKVGYSFGDDASDLARNSSTVVKFFKDSGTQVAVTVAALNDAINALSGSANYSAATSSFTFDALHQKAMLLYPNV